MTPGDFTTIAAAAETLRRWGLRLAIAACVLGAGAIALATWSLARGGACP